MKLPFEFGVRLFFRLIVPGVFVTAGLYPALLTFLKLTGWSAYLGYAVLVLVFLTGWLLVICDAWIYMIFEGRRLWPKWLWKFFLTREQKRLKNLCERIAAFDELQQHDARSEKQNLEDHAEQRNFPLNDEGDYSAEFPTRIGNLICAYEGHSLRVYGMSSVFYWNRLWLQIDKDLREEVDNRQAVADSTVYTSFGLYLAAFTWILYSVFLSIHLLISQFAPAAYNYLPSFKVTLIENLPSLSGSWLVSFAFFVSGYIVYRLSLPVQVEFGDLFKALFDDYHDKVNVQEVINILADSTGRAEMSSLPRTASKKVVWRFLQYYRVRCPNGDCNQLMKPSELKTHKCAVR